jgi:hypothetical protein
MEQPMTEVQDLADRYVAAWNERDPSARRRLIQALWRADGSTCHRPLDSQGLDAIVARVAGSNDKWVRDRDHLFRAGTVVTGHHDVVMINWEMVPRGRDEVVSLGLSFLVHDGDGRLARDIQFPEPPPEPEPEPEPEPALIRLVERYVAAWDEPDPAARRALVQALWRVDGSHVDVERRCRGHAEIAAETDRIHDRWGAKGSRFRAAGRIDGHHDAVRLDWERVAPDGATILAAGTSLLLVDDDGRLQRDIQFDVLAQRPIAG